MHLVGYFRNYIIMLGFTNVKSTTFIWRKLSFRLIFADIKVLYIIYYFSAVLLLNWPSQYCKEWTWRPTEEAYETIGLETVYSHEVHCFILADVYTFLRRRAVAWQARNRFWVKSLKQALRHFFFSLEANYMLDVRKRITHSTSTLMTRYFSSFLLCLVEVSESFTSHRGAVILCACCR